MSDDLQERTRAYYSSHVVGRWLEHVYQPAGAEHFPFGLARELVVRDVIAHHALPPGLAYDLGCGGGQLAVALAGLGFRVRAVDFSPAMLVEAATAAEGAGVRDRVDLIALDVLQQDPTIGAGVGGLVIAMGFLEYCPDPSRFFDQVRRCLAPGGVAIVEFRNRLFNAFSGNAFTAREAGSGDLPALIAEASRYWTSTAISADDVENIVTLLRSTELSPAATKRAAAVPPFPGERLQHTFDEVAALARTAGLETVELLGLHPHPFPPATESAAPVAYNAIAWSLQRAPRNPLVLMSCSSAAAVLRATM